MRAPLLPILVIKMHKTTCRRGRACCSSNKKRTCCHRDCRASALTFILVIVRSKSTGLITPFTCCSLLGFFNSVLTWYSLLAPNLPRGDDWLHKPLECMFVMDEKLHSQKRCRQICTKVYPTILPKQDQHKFSILIHQYRKNERERGSTRFSHKESRTYVLILYSLVTSTLLQKKDYNHSRTLSLS